MLSWGKIVLQCRGFPYLQCWYQFHHPTRLGHSCSPTRTHQSHLRPHHCSHILTPGEKDIWETNHVIKNNWKNSKLSDFWCQLLQLFHKSFQGICSHLSIMLLGIVLELLALHFFPFIWVIIGVISSINCNLGVVLNVTARSKTCSSESVQWIGVIILTYSNWNSRGPKMKP